MKIAQVGVPLGLGRTTVEHLRKTGYPGRHRLQDLAVLFVILIGAFDFNLAVARSWVEDSRADFADGTAIGGLGASLYASIDGKLQMVGNDWDLNDDGWLDIVLTNERDVYGDHHVPTQIYWGSPNGFDTSQVDTLSTFGAEAAAIADLDRDGYLDIVICNSGHDWGYDIYSYIFWGSAMGYANANRGSLYTHCPHGTATPADLNNDGYLDLVFSSWYPSDSWSYIYWGRDTGYSATALDSVPTHTGHGNWVADFDRDGRLDILFANYADSIGNTNICSYLYWGSEGGYSFLDKDSMPTHDAGDDISVADLNRDGWLDIVFPNHSSEGIYHGTYSYSYIYYGSRSGFSSANSVWLPTVASWSSSVADLNRDGWLDLVFSNFPYDHTYYYSYIYWGGMSGYSIGRRDSLYTRGGSAVMIADYNNDGYEDILLGNQSYGADTTWYAYIYWNSPYGFALNNRDSLPTKAVDASVTRDLGNTYTRDTTETYFSSVFDASTQGDSIAYWSTVSWRADTIWKGELPLPSGVTAGLEVYVRTGNRSEPGTGWSDWLVMGNGSVIPGSLASRYIQYKTVFHTDYKASLALDSVAIDYQLFPNSERPILTNQPNPFSERTDIIYEVPSGECEVGLDIYDISGRLVKRLVHGERLRSGFHTSQWMGRDDRRNRVATGIYVCRLEMASEKLRVTKVRKTMLLH